MITNKKTEKVIRLYEFLKEYQRIKSPVLTELGEQEWSSGLEGFEKVALDGQVYQVNKPEDGGDSELFDTMYGLYARMKKEPESIELVYGDGHLYQEGDRVCDHPFILQTMSLEFEPEEQRFLIGVGDKMPELYQSFLGSVQGMKEEALIELTKAFAYQPISPMDHKAVDEMLQKVGEVLEGAVSQVVLTRKPVLFLRKRNQGFGTAIDWIIEDMIKGKEIPPFIADIVGAGDAVRKGQKNKEAFKKLAVDVNGIDQKVLFTKPANKEQLLVAKHLERNEAVLVQGPPGTGKTHTIANMLGHFLAEGKSVLVTSYSEKALAVLKNQVPKDLQSLCVSVLGDAESRKELEKSLEVIQDKRGTLERSELTRRVAMYEKNREACVRTLDKLKGELKNLKLNEYTPLKVAGKMYKAVDAAKYVDAHREACEWLIGPVRHGALFPLGEDKVQKLYEMQGMLTEEDEIICKWPVAVSELLTPEALTTFTEHEKKCKKKTAPLFEKYFKPSEEMTEESLKELMAALEVLKEGIRHEEKWCAHVLEAGKDDKAKEKWQSLVSDIKEVYQLSMTYADEILAREPQILPVDSKIKPLDVYSQINQKLQGGGKLSKMMLLFNPQIKAVVGASRINGRQPETMAEFETLIHHTVLEEKRENLKLKWERQMTALGAPAVKEMGEQFEVGCQKYGEAISRYLEWYKKKWLPMLKRLENLGLECNAVLENQALDIEVGSEIHYIKETFIGEVCDLLQYKIDNLQKVYGKDCKQVMERAIQDYTESTKSECLMGLKMALRTGDLERYKKYYEEIQKAKEKTTLFVEREELLEKLSFAAPGWAEKLRMPVVTEPEVCPTNIEEAWLWRQFKEMLEKRHERTVTMVKEEMAEVEKRLQHYTLHLTVDKAWLHKLVDFDANRSEVQAIEGWKQLMMRMGAGKGKQTEILRAEARKLMPKCQKAVPVWIMPLNKVADHFDPRENKFDVVIIDEASQADMMALVALYLGKQVLIVGDHEQVSPLAIGERVEEMERLVKTYLEDMPNYYLYSGRFSLYDLAQLSGYQPVKLKEHFRCVPEIIGYSNALAYNGQIEPLRESSKVIQPPLQMMYVEGATEKGQVNEKEARTIVAQILACCDNPAYEGKSFGVISLKGDKQASYIDQMLQKEMTATAYEKRHILCGNPSHFQGDERDIIFISFVDTALKGELLRLMTYGADNLYKKRYNVAMSRGREQVFLCHSFDPMTQLKEEDIRTELFQYCYNVGKESEKDVVSYEEPLAEFDAMIKEELESLGFEVKSHKPSGELLTGLVVTKDGKQVRLICDSEKWQEEVALDEEIARQAVLERIGWQFIHISATAFYMNRHKSMEKIVQSI